MLAWLVCVLAFSSVCNVLASPDHLGCYKDDDQKMMKGKWVTGAKVDVKWCTGMCDYYGYGYAGLEDGDYCFCSNDINTDDYPKTDDGECDVNCFADASVNCGGKHRISVYKIEGYLGCFDNEESGIMIGSSYTNNKISVTSCLKQCKSELYRFAGLQDSDTCFCSSSFNSSRTLEDDSECDKPCVAASDEKCGGDKNTAIYNVGFNMFYGCWKDSEDNPMMKGYSQSDPYMDGDWCGYLCSTFKYGGLTGGNTCLCSDDIDFDAYDRRYDSECDYPCWGNEQQTCGGDNRIGVYKN